jgi:hypothetical protein
MVMQEISKEDIIPGRSVYVDPIVGTYSLGIVTEVRDNGFDYRGTNMAGTTTFDTAQGLLITPGTSGLELKFGKLAPNHLKFLFQGLLG